MAKPKANTSLATALVQSCLQLHARRLWTKFSNTDVFSIVIEGVDERFLVNVMGQGGQEYGLTILAGPPALEHFAAMVGGGGEDMEAAMHIWGLSIDDRSDIPHEFRGILKAARFFGKEAPFLFVKLPNCHPEAPTERDQRIFLFLVRGLLEAHERGLLRRSRPLAGEPWLELAVSGSPLMPKVAARVLPVDLTVLGEASELPMGRLDEVAMRRLGRSEREILIGYPQLPMGIQGESGIVRLLVAMDAENGKVLAHVMTVGTPLTELESQLEELFSDPSVGGLPARLIFESEAFFEAYEESFTRIGVSCVYDPEHPGIDQLVEGMVEFQERKEVEEPVRDNPQTLAEWKRVERALTETLGQAFIDEGRMSARAQKRFFGANDWLEESELHHSSMVELMTFAFLEWGVVHYRPTKRSQTIAEKLLPSLAAHEKAIVEARLAADVRIYAVEDCDPDVGQVTLRDVSSGEHWVIEDRGLSGSAAVDLCLVGSVYQVAGTNRFSMLGPPLHLARFDEIRTLLQRHGLSFENGVLSGKLEAVGRLWPLFLQQTPRRRVLQNTSGESLRICKATFELKDPAAFWNTLDEHEDFETTESGGGCWRWIRQVGGTLGSVSFGTFEILDDVLVVETNSEERMQEARALVEHVGARFVRMSSEALDLESLQEKQALDDATGSEDGMLFGEMQKDDMMEALQAHIDEMLMRSLDEPVPMFGGKTPREMARTKPGAEEVRRWIQSYPRSGSPHGPLDVPRDRMLRELGLEE